MSDKGIEKLIAEKVQNNELPCAVAFYIAEKLAISPAEVGAYADGHKLRLVKCQLGLFGYEPEKRIVKPADSVSADIETPSGTRWSMTGCPANQPGRWRKNLTSGKWRSAVPVTHWELRLSLASWERFNLRSLTDHRLQSNRVEREW